MKVSGFFQFMAIFSGLLGCLIKQTDLILLGIILALIAFTNNEEAEVKLS